MWPAGEEGQVVRSQVPWAWGLLACEFGWRVLWEWPSTWRCGPPSLHQGLAEIGTWGLGLGHPEYCWGTSVSPALLQLLLLSCPC